MHYTIPLCCTWSLCLSADRTLSTCGTFLHSFVEWVPLALAIFAALRPRTCDHVHQEEACLKKSLQSLLNTLNIFYKISVMNCNKTNAIWIGKSTTTTEWICEDVKLVWTQEEYTVLGVKFSTVLVNLSLINLDCKLRKMQSLFTQWDRRRLTLLGHSCSEKSNGNLAHNTSIYCASEPIKGKIEKMMYEFLWNIGPDKIKRSVII